MNNLNLNVNNLPLTATMLGTLQSYWQILEKFAHMGGEKFVLSGCAEQGGNVGSGWVVIDGEIMEVPSGGSAAGNVYVYRSSETVTVQDGQYTKNKVELKFGNGSNNFPWSYVKRVESLKSISDHFAAVEYGLAQKANTTHIHAPAEVGEDANLNNYKTAGMFYCTANATAATISNTPVDEAFSLLVEKASGVKQTFTMYHNRHRTFVRTWYEGNDTWGEWIEQTMTYTSFAQLGLTDNDFDQLNWETNANLIFDRMAPGSSFKAGMCGSAEMPRLNDSLVDSCPLSNGATCTPALEFNKEANTSTPCVVVAKDNNSARYAYYNTDNSGSKWVEMAVKPTVGAVANVVMGSVALVDTDVSEFLQIIPIGTTMPDTNYKVFIQPLSAGVRDFWIHVTAKTTTSFTVTVKCREGESQNMNIDWVMIF